MNSKEKMKFRATSKWRNFRKYLIQQRGKFCECCGSPCSRPQVHHIDEANYTDLKPSRFALLCNLCHQSVSKLERIKKENWCKYNAEWVKFYGRFLT